MILFKKAADLKNYLDSAPGPRGFVPTMGALHEGHLALIRAAREQSAVTICSIFVNPTQFNDPADFEKYPVTIENDILLLEKAGCDVLFLPAVTEIYPDGLPSEQYNLGRIETLLEGAFRPGHFQGVCQVVSRLLNLVQPDLLFMGQKDYQQCMVIARLLELKNMATRLVICPTLREPSGLAMSSRNMRLTETQREQAIVIYRALQQIRSELGQKTPDQLAAEATKLILEAGFEKTDYVSICDARTLEPVTGWDGETKLVALAAAFIGSVRLIDNLLLN
ncbi:pantoate--beta-alanine ligase [Sediminibacterium ginsengisoli]|uniref:Pantothenate synthetase n=1 Tax=Sediminibacterium ginsengisoli TaxID=413434 RepID=A0A1T4L821_9BACT|nr:pantoate--beta-alanine ligase [Sediminibacterium ginsengisoli]SJZ50681.1 pantoate--beta-alanine ligase [Sediminibacterium ginsengisoli]